MAGQSSVCIPFSCKLCSLEASDQQLRVAVTATELNIEKAWSFQRLLLTSVVKLQRRCFSGAFGRAVQQNAPG